MYKKMTKADLIEQLEALKAAKSSCAEASASVSSPAANDAEQLLQELQIHQVELEMQNRELIESRQQLEESRDRYAALYDFAPVGYASLDERGVIREINLAAAALLGAERSQLHGQPFIRYLAASDLYIFIDQMQRARTSRERAVVEVSLALKSGRLTLMQMLRAPAQAPELPAYRTAIIDITERRQMEDELRRARAEMEEKIEERTRELSEANAELQLEMIERKLAEEALRRTEAELAHATRITALAELAVSIAHEINQPLGAIVTNSQAGLRLLSRESPDLDKSREIFEQVISDSMRASHVIARIRALLKKNDAERALLNVNEVIQEVISLTGAELSKNEIRLQTVLAADLPLVWGDRVQLQQVILNLILNAKEAMSAAGWEPRELSITSLASRAGEAVVAVCDSGTGLDPLDSDRIFEAFFTTKAEGLGLGLSISRTIIEAHGGRLWAISNKDRGATIQFALPAGGEGRG